MGATAGADAMLFSDVRAAGTASRPTDTEGPRHPVGASLGATAFGDARSVAVGHALCAVLFAANGAAERILERLIAASSRHIRGGRCLGMGARDDLRWYAVELTFGASRVA